MFSKLSLNPIVLLHGARAIQGQSLQKITEITFHVDLILAIELLRPEGHDAYFVVGAESLELFDMILESICCLVGVSDADCQVFGELLGMLEELIFKVVRHVLCLKIISRWFPKQRIVLCVWTECSKEVD